MKNCVSTQTLFRLSWKRRENFFTHMVSVHFRHLWDQDIPKTAPLFTCTVPSCSYSTKYRYNMLFHLGGRHKQLRDKIRAEGYDDLILSPIDPEVEPDAAGVNGDDSFRYGWIRHQLKYVFISCRHKNYLNIIVVVGISASFLVFRTCRPQTNLMFKGF